MDFLLSVQLHFTINQIYLNNSIVSIREIKTGINSLRLR